MNYLTEWNMSDNNPYCYSYSRYSSLAQQNGSSIARQTRLAKEIAKDLGLDLIEYCDKGVSAFRGKNSESGKLASFIEDVKNGLIPKGSWLIVENFDRISRDNIYNAQTLFLELINLDITIVTGMDRRVYNKESINKNPLDLMVSILHFARAHDESVIKSNRTNGAAKALIENHNAGIRSPDGYPIALNSVGSNKFWVDCSDKSVKPHPVYFPIAQEMIQMCLDGKGTHIITGHLNEKYPAPLPKSKRDRGEVGVWTLNRTNKFFRSRTLLGEKEVNLNGQTYILKDYYPPLVDEATFYQIQALRKQRNVKPANSNKVYLFTGNKQLYCAHCGSRMTNLTHNRNKEEIKRYDKYRYVCANTKFQCRSWSFNALWLDDTIIRLASNHVFRPTNQTKEFDVAIKGIEENINTKQANIRNLIDLIKSGVSTKAIPSEIANLEFEVEQLYVSLQELQAKRESELKDSVEWGEIDDNILDYEQSDLRRSAKERIKSAIKLINCEQIRQGFIKFEITFINGITLRAYRTRDTLVFDGIAWAKLGDFYRQPVKIKTEDLKKLEFGDPLENTVYNKSRLDKLFDHDAVRHLRNKVISAPAENTGYNTHYQYNGLGDVSVEMMRQYELGENPPHLTHDLTRAKYIANWADGLKGAPKKIEDQFYVYKHTQNEYVIKKHRPEICFIENVEFPKYCSK
ncbi:recombinase family protein [Shewanella aestuarii]|uniref:Recombinase family protein n=1 Tax=Shewanella aestuarii TaxID=1028752 RepID=A0A6G9QGQ8_9GAMM|nr:recombinase family protein [Shewanella aestuarii]QIR13578.1 recombinase family protein [Shewanella aestuarii]